jgi:hypothetical protein
MKIAVHRLLRIPGMMVPILKHAITFSILLLFLAGTSGITAREHICSSSNRVTVTVFPELTGMENGCCCNPCSPEPEFSNSAAGHRSLDSQDCCKTIRLYLKVAFTGLPIQLSSFQILAPLSDTRFLPGFCPANELSENIRISSCFTDTGPPVSGRERILALNRNKIPDPHLTVS